MRLSFATLGVVLVGLVPSIAAAQAKARKIRPEGFEGQVTAVGSSSTLLVQMNIGSDAKVEVGHTLHVYRPGNLPEYLGTVVITAVVAKASVGKFNPAKPSARIKEGDLVIVKGPPQM
jgi:hypothetical protein